MTIKNIKLVRSAELRLWLVAEYIDEMPKITAFNLKKEAQDYIKLQSDPFVFEYEELPIISFKRMMSYFKRRFK